jgi:hypothetical protein
VPARFSGELEVSSKQSPAVVAVVCSRGLMFEEAIRVRFPLIDLVLAVLVIILLVLVVRDLIY